MACWDVYDILLDETSCINNYTKLLQQQKIKNWVIYSLIFKGIHVAISLHLYPCIQKKLFYLLRSRKCITRWPICHNWEIYRKLMPHSWRPLWLTHRPLHNCNHRQRWKIYSGYRWRNRGVCHGREIKRGNK